MTDQITITGNIHPVPTSREGSIQRVLDDELVKACATIRNTAEQFKEDTDRARSAVLEKFLHEQEITDLVDFARDADHVQKLADTLENFGKKVQESSRALTLELQAYMSQLAICPKTGEYVVSCYSDNDCKYCATVFPENYNHYLNPKIMPVKVLDERGVSGNGRSVVQ